MQFFLVTGKKFGKEGGEAERRGKKRGKNDNNDTDTKPHVI
jgi:hypothetical protein